MSIKELEYKLAFPISILLRANNLFFSDVFAIIEVVSFQKEEITETDLFKKLFGKVFFILHVF